MKFNARNINILLLAVVIHLGIAVAFMFSKISSMKETTRIEFEFEKPQVDEKTPLEEEKKKVEEEKKQVEQQINEMVAGERRKNIGVNVNEKVKEEISTENYMKQIQDQLNAGRPQPSAKEATTKNIDDDKPKEANMNATPEPKHDKPGVFHGPTNIYYDLANRHDVYLPIPVYKCQGMGKIVIQIVVSTDGTVLEAILNKTASENNECLQNTALAYARRTRFNVDNKAPAKQGGTLTYVFVAQ